MKQAKHVATRCRVVRLYAGDG